MEPNVALTYCPVRGSHYKLLRHHYDKPSASLSPARDLRTRIKRFISLKRRRVLCDAIWSIVSYVLTLRRSTYSVPNKYYLFCNDMRRRSLCATLRQPVDRVYYAALFRYAICCLPIRGNFSVVAISEVWPCARRLPAIWPLRRVCYSTLFHFADCFL